jgi:hypothetical protein
MLREDGPQVPAEAGAAEIDVRRDMERCRAEIQEAQRLLRSGHPDVEGLCLALADWSAELKLLEGQSWNNESSNF